jgi:hypothetical protein
LRAIQRAAAREADPIVDWFHIAMRWQHVHQLATGAMRQGQTAARAPGCSIRLSGRNGPSGMGSSGRRSATSSELRVWRRRSKLADPLDSEPHNRAAHRRSRPDRPSAHSGGYAGAPATRGPPARSRSPNPP